LIGESLGNYQILELLGLGGMGRVYRGYDTTLERDVAIKVLPEELADDPDRLARLERAAKLLAALNHPNVATIHSLEEVAGIRFLVMELVEGETLARRLAQGPLAITDCLEISCQIAHGLEAAHDKGILHRDLKPANVMVSDQGSVKVLDFGVAKPLHVAKDSKAMAEARTQEASLTAAGALLGTAPYMSPEQVRGQVLDKRSDIWAFGCVLYEMLTGEHTFARKTMPDTWAAVLEHEPDWSKLPSQTPELVRGLLARCLQKDPDRRLRDIGDARLEIEPELDAMRRSSDVPRVATPRSRPRVAAGLGLAAILLGVVAVFGPIYIWPPGDQAGGGAAAGALDPAQWVIAVVPVTTGAADDKEITALNEGLAFTLTGRLSQLSREHGLQVMPASMVREEDIDSLEKARIVLGVTLAIGFATRQVGDRIRVTANLVDVPGRRQLDAATIWATADDLIDLEERVTVAALRMLRVELLPTERQSFDIGTRDTRAYDLFLRGQGYLGDFIEPANVEAAIDLFEQALAADSTYARARAGLGEAFWHHYGHTNERRWVDRAIEECRRAIDLDELEPMGHVCLGTLYEGTGRPELAVEEFALATGLDPNLDAAYRGLAAAYEAQAKLELAEATYKEAILARPHYWAGHSWLARFYLGQGRYEESIAAYEEVIRLAPEGYGGYSDVGVAYYYAERWNDACRTSPRCSSSWSAMARRHEPSSVP